MKTFIFGLLVLFLGAQAQAEYCNWGFRPPDRFKCEGEEFVYGSPACQSGIYSKVFCRASESGSGRACADDNESITLRCAKSLLGIGPGAPDEPQVDEPKPRIYCSPGFVPGRFHVCNGKRYFADSAACDAQGHHRSIFCAEEFADDVQACIDDNAAETHRCQMLLFGRAPLIRNFNSGKTESKSNSNARGAQ